MRERHRAKLAGDVLCQTRAWKLFCLVPKMLLHRPRNTGSLGRDELAQRVVKFQRDQWAQLIREANECSSLPSLVPPRTPEEEAIRRGLIAQSRVQREQVSRARQALIGASLAPRNSETLDALQNRRPQERISAIPQEVLHSASEDFATGVVPPTVGRALLLATMTALRKDDGGVRGIATGLAFRRLVAEMFGEAVWQDGGSCMFSISVRLVNQCRHGSCGPRDPSSDRREPFPHCDLHRWRGSV